MKKIWALLLLLALVPTGAGAQIIVPVGDMFVNVDYARFMNNDTSGYVEVYYGFYPNSLTFVKSDEQYRGGMLLTTRILDTETRTLVEERRTPVQFSQKDTAGVWYRYPVVTQKGFVLPYGRYALEVLAEDSLAPARRDSVVGKIDIGEYMTEVCMSDLQLCKSIKRSKQANDLFYKNSLEVVPLPALVFGVATSPVLFHYAELYNVAPGETYKIKTSIIDENNEVVRENVKKQKYRGHSGLLVGNTTVTSFRSGTYKLLCTVYKDDSTEISRREKSFNIYNPHLNVNRTAIATRIARDFANLSAEELSQEFAYAKYLATSEEIQTFRQLTSDSGMREFLARFWVDIETQIRSKPKVSRASYLNRIRLANDQFGSFGKDGWKTDRGRVFAIYGKPDEVEKSPAETGTKAFEIWYYFTIESGVEFVFVDRTGYNNFQLVHSTKRDELQDESWQRYLQ